MIFILRLLAAAAAALVVVVMQVERCNCMQRREPSQSRCVRKRTCVSPPLSSFGTSLRQTTRTITNKAHPRKAITITKYLAYRAQTTPGRVKRENQTVRATCFLTGSRLSLSLNTLATNIYSARQAAKSTG
ncbi:hypothetical protein H112_03136 [Trichophyton rubrum D6]|uniref:Secreted protein n=3 Tax=Trichophyton TaxID=5550 RepID=A0A080WKA9_TRIRC|nr:uncharacterized protein TERG_12332 [Trichophyton rubrum CBS 118892]EZF24262.1 hypothetical protein H100_03141 [Trichophyton rubrum MR850]EZF43426.1 hypothetical protein H102_03135 [Trichophyton rubrum CBS 100081]EZF54068.1 hypothetical protein H103_03149 [Trichophyton rubrum CBS 288.86]EZF64670.1 hypothetical protein H104_03131 [Trichophyton rubrum CBS 289.86]EZF75251.1 hypothetical protein H105_03154 [Trichophyton soudanense CBS 452.61]EZF85973.1 hypothetical protein H110_03142 [Trichophy